MSAGSAGSGGSNSGGPPWDPEDPRFKRWRIELNVALDDVDAIIKDMMRPLRKRELGHVKHRELHAEAWGKIMSLLGRAIPEGEPEDDPGMH